MRTLIVSSLILPFMFAVVGCGAGTNKCKKDTVLVSFTASGVDADSLGVSVAISGGAPKTASYAFPSKGSGTIEIDFPSGYPSGKSVTVTLTAEKGGVVVASDSQSVTLDESCKTLALTLSSGVIVDMSMGDAGDASVSGDMTGANKPHAVIAAMPDVVGFVTKLDGSGSTDPMGRTLTYAWHFMSVPPMSAIGDANLTPSASVDKVAFDPDFGGTYTVQLTVTAPDSTSDTATMDVVVPTIPVFYMEAATVDGGDGTLTMGVVQSDGSGKHAVTCNFIPDGGFGGGFSPSQFVGEMSLIDLVREQSLMPPASSVAAFTEFSGNNNAATGKLYLADETMTCGGKTPTQIDVGDSFSDNHMHAWPRFSPNGQRVAYLDFPLSGSGNARVVTAGIDGSNLHVVRSAALATPSMAPVPPAWIDDTHLAWVEQDTSSGTHVYIVTASDAQLAGDSSTGGGDRAQVRDCTGANNLIAINQVEPVSGSYLVSGQLTATGSKGSVNLYRLGADCDVNNATHILDEPAYGRAFNFELSPDKLTLLFSSTHGQNIQADGGDPGAVDDIFIMPSDGSSAPRKLAGAPNIEDIGPRFVAGGRQVVWTQVNANGNADLGDTHGGIFIINLDGTHQRQLYADGKVNNNTTAAAGAGGNGGFFIQCDWIPGAAPASAGIVGAFALLLLALGLRRRRTR